MGSAEFNIHVKEMLSPLAKVVGEKKPELNSANIYPRALMNVRSYGNNNKTWIHNIFPFCIVFFYLFVNDLNFYPCSEGVSALEHFVRGLRGASRLGEKGGGIP